MIAAVIALSLVADSPCVEIGAAAGPKASLTSRLCLDSDGTLFEERSIGRATRRRPVVVPLELATAPEPTIDARFDAHRALLARASDRLFAARADPTRILALARADAAIRTVLVQSLSVDAQLAPKPNALFAQRLAAVPWVHVEAPVIWSKSGALLSVSYWPYGDFYPNVGYSQHASQVLRATTLDVVYDAPGWVPAFDGEDPVLSVLVDRCGVAPRTMEELVEDRTCAGRPPRGIYERWEAVVHVDAFDEPYPLRVIGPFKYGDACGESGPPGVFARFFTGC